MAKPTPGKQVAAKKPTEVAVPSYIKTGTNRGSENQTMDDQTVPRLGLIQDLSPQHKKNKPGYIQGASPGMFFNTATRKLYGETIDVVNVFFDKEYLLWRDQDAGGGFGGAFRTVAEALEAQHSKDKPEEWEIQDTAQHYCIAVHEDGTTEYIVISLARSKLKASRPWNSLIQATGGDRFSRVYRVSAVEDQNANNQDYWNIRVDQLGFPDEETYHKAEEFYEFVRSGKLVVDRKYEQEEERVSRGTAGGGTKGKSRPAVDEEDDERFN